MRATFNSLLLLLLAIAPRPATAGPIIVTGPDAGGGPDVRVFDAVTGTLILSFFGFDPGFLGGVRVGSVDANGDGTPDVTLTAGPGGGPHLRVFRYTPGVSPSGRARHYGLIAEEVAEVYPELVSRDAQGAPAAVSYHALPVMLLNELQRQARELDELRRQLATRAAEIATLRREQAALRTELDRITEIVARVRVEAAATDRP